MSTVLMHLAFFALMSLPVLGLASLTAAIIHERRCQNAERREAGLSDEQ